MNKYEQLSEYLKQYEPLNDWLYFNTSTMEEGNVSLNSIENLRYLQEYIDGSKDVELLFAISMIKEYDENTSDINLEAINEVNHFADWLEEQDYNENYPNFGIDNEVYELKVLSNAPSLSVDPDRNLARYQFSCSVNYIEKRR